jgi:ankyrin repeat protein
MSFILVRELLSQLTITDLEKEELSNNYSLERFQTMIKNNQLCQILKTDILQLILLYDVWEILFFAYTEASTLVFKNIYNILKKETIKFASHQQFFEANELVEIFNEGCKRNDLPLIQFFLEDGYDINNSNVNAMDGIFLLIDKDYLDSLEYLILNSNVNLNVRDIYGFTPYMVILLSPQCYRERIDLIQLCEERGCLLNVSDYKRVVEVFYDNITENCQEQNPQFQYLLSKPITDEHEGNTTRMEILQRLVVNDDIENIKFMLEHFLEKINLNNILCYSVENGSLATTQVILTFDPDLTNALDLSINNDNYPVVKLLLTAGCSVDSTCFSSDLYIRNSRLFMYLVQILIQQRTAHLQVLNELFYSSLAFLMADYLNSFDETPSILQCILFSIRSSGFKNKAEQDQYNQTLFQNLEIVVQYTNLKSANGTQCLSTAIMLGNKDIIRLLIRNHASITREELEDTSVSKNLMKYVLGMLENID